MGVKRDYRLNWILQKLEMRGVVSVKELADELETSFVTIRKDLEDLEKEEKAVRIVGGAIAREKQNADLDRLKNKEEKRNVYREIARKTASELIEKRDTLIVANGDLPYTALCYTKMQMDLIVLTNSFHVAEMLKKRVRYTVILLGGQVNKDATFVYGKDADKQISRYMADKIIMQVDGIHPQTGLTVADTEGIHTLQAMMNRAKKRIILADNSVLGRESFFNIGNLSSGDVVVTQYTEERTVQKVLKQIAHKGIEIVYANKT